MTSAQIDAMIAGAYNLHVGPVVRGEPMTPDKASKLSRDERRALAAKLQDDARGFYTAAEVAQLMAAV